MDNNHYENQRKQRLRTLRNYIGDEAPVKKKDLYAYASWEWGVTRETAKDYVETLLVVNKIEEDEEDEDVIEGVIE